MGQDPNPEHTHFHRNLAWPPGHTGNHFHLIIRHQVLGYRLNTYRLEVTGYSEDLWWREFYINFVLSRLQFGSHPIGPTGDGPLGWNGDGDELPPHGE